MDLEKAKEEKARWAETRLAKSPVRKAETDSGIEVEVLYGPDDLADKDYFKDIGFPGEYPFTRGVYPSMYRGNLWTMRQYAGFATAEESNARFKYLLEQGQTGLSVAFDLPTQMGYDSDDPLVEEEVGRVGVAIDTLGDMELLFDGIPLDKISTSFTINAPAIIILAMYIAAAERQGVPMGKLSGTVQNDILKEYLARGTFIYPPEPSLRLTTDVIEFCFKHIPRFNPISISGYHIREAGASAVQEVACCLSEAITYVEDLVKRGIDVDQFAPRLSFHFTVGHQHFFEEIAKIRAARRMWARIARERFGAKDPRSCAMRFFAGGGGITLTAQEPLNNVVRTTLQCLANVLAGGQSIHVMAYDEAYAIPSEESARLGLRTQQIIAYETGVADTADPLGGSYYLEALTDAVENKALEFMAEIEGRGGMLAAIRAGFVQREVLNRAYEIEKKIRSGERIVVGVNKFVAEGEAIEEKLELHEADPEATRKQIARLREAKARRNPAEVEGALEAVRNTARGNDNLVPPVIEAVKVGATAGEITGVLVKVFGRFKDPVQV